MVSRNLVRTGGISLPRTCGWIPRLTDLGALLADASSPCPVRGWDLGVELEISMRVYGPWSAKEALGAAQIHNPLG